MSILKGFDHKSTGLRMFHYETDHDMKFHINTTTFLSIYCFLGGKASFLVEGTRYPMEPGDVIIVRPGEAHMPIIDHSVPYERARVGFSPSLLSGLTENDSLLEPFFNREPGTKNLYRVQDFGKDVGSYYFSRMQKSAADPRINIIANTLLLLQHIGKVYRKNQFAEPPQEGPAQKILHYIGQHLGEELSIQELCEEFYISSAQLCRIIKKATGTSVGKYIAAKRLSEAQLLICQGHKPTQVCGLCGYPNYASFYRAYTNHFGRTPKEEFLSSTIEDAE